MRLIDADKIDFNEVFKGESDFARDTREAAQRLIDEQPTIEARPMVHGEWIYEYHTWHCNICGCHPYKGYIPKEPSKFCPNCGARMDGKAV